MNTIEIPNSSTLSPRTVTLANGNKAYLFPSESTELLKIDFCFEAGAAYQPQLLCAAATNKLMTTATESMDASRLSEFMDFRGVILEPNNDLLQSSLTVYMLRKYAEETLPVVKEMLTRPAFSDEDFGIWQGNKRQELLTMERRSSAMTRRLFYESLFGEKHPLGLHASYQDVDRLGLEAVKGFFAERYHLGNCTIVMAGKTDEALIGLVDGLFGNEPIVEGQERMTLAMPQRIAPRHAELKMEGSVQTTVRIGRVLPLRWNDMDYARFMILTTMLGGYFGSRLMSNLREDKGYCYGIYAKTQVYRGVTVFFITADVAQGTAADATSEIQKELDLLVNEPAGEEELRLVKTVIAGDFIRSVDGVFERSARFCDMIGADVTEALTDNLRSAIETTTAEQLRDLAECLLGRDNLTVCRAGC